MILGFALLALEMLLPTGFIFLWVGIGAIVVGALGFLIPGLGLGVEFALWGGFSVCAVLAWRHFKPMSFESERPTLNRRGHSYLGRVFTLAEPIVDGVGKLRVDDSQWRIMGADLPAGVRVQVTDVQGATLIVERIAE